MESNSDNIKVDSKSSENDPDYLLVERCKQGDRMAFNELMLKYHRQVFNIVFRVVADYNQADEIAQDVFIRAYRGISGFKYKAKVLTWLYTIAINLSRNWIKKNCRLKSRQTSLDAPVIGDNNYCVKREVSDTKLAPDVAVLNKEKQILIEKAINELADDFREVVILRDIQMVSYEEIAKILAINIGTVKSRLYRARQILQDKLKDLV